MIIMKMVIIVIITIMITIIHSLFAIIIINIIYKNYDKIVKKSKNTLKCLIKI